METGQQPWHTPPMNDNPTHPYTLDVSKLPDGRSQWAVRERGKLLQRSDRLQHSEQSARENLAQTQIRMHLPLPNAAATCVVENSIIDARLIARKLSKYRDPSTVRSVI